MLFGNKSLPALRGVLPKKTNGPSVEGPSVAAWRVPCRVQLDQKLWRRPTANELNLSPASGLRRV